MELPSDVWRLILLICRVRDITNLCSVDKFLYNLCCEKSLWYEKFEEKNLVIVNDKVTSISQYIDEYKKVSHASYTTNCLVNMIMCDKYDIQWRICRFGLYFVIDELTKILNKNHIVFIKIKDNLEKYIKISIKIRERGTIYYRLHDVNEDDRRTNSGVNILTETCDKNYTVSLINKILYNYPSINITDDNCIPLVVSKYNLDDYNMWFKNLHPERKEYWDECYSKYEELYF